jgi:hypothetical protein
MKVWRHFHGQNKADLYNYLPPGVDNCKVFYINFNPYKMSDNIFCTTILRILNKTWNSLFNFQRVLIFTASAQN